MTTTFYGQGVALAGMKTACGAVLIATQFTDVVEYGTGGGGTPVQDSTFATSAAAIVAVAAAGSAKNVVEGDTAKKVTRLFWSYGDGESPVTGKSRFHVDLNLHIETENYGAGEKVEVVIENDSGEDVSTNLKSLELQATVGADGCAKIKNVFAGKTVDITASA